MGLVNFARVLNGELGVGTGPGVGTPRPEWVAEEQAARDQAVAVVEAALGAEYPEIPPAAAAAFDALADGQAVEYAVRRIHLRGPWLLRPDYRTPVHLVCSSARARMAAWLSYFFVNPYRDRFRRCQQCGRWFADLTRNKAARRCSRACTIAYSNAKRKERRR